MEQKKVLILAGGASIVCTVVICVILILIWLFNQEEDTTTSTNDTSTNDTKKSTSTSTRTSTEIRTGSGNQNTERKIGLFSITSFSTQGFTIVLNPNFPSSGINSDESVNIDITPTPINVFNTGINWGIINNKNIAGTFVSGTTYTVNINIGNMYSTPVQFTPISQKSMGSLNVKYKFISNSDYGFKITIGTGYTNMNSNDNISISMYNPDNSLITSTTTPSSIVWSDLNSGVTVSTTSILNPNTNYKILISCCGGSVQYFTYSQIKSLGTFSITNININSFNINLNSGTSYGMDGSELINIFIYKPDNTLLTSTTTPTNITWANLNNARVNGNFSAGVHYNVFIKSTDLKDSGPIDLFNDASNNFIIKSKAGNFCLEDKLDGTVQGTTCSSSSVNSQQWTYDNSTKQIKSVASINSCLELKDGSPDNNVDVIMRSCINGFKRQKWSYISTNQFKNYMGDTCLDLYNMVGPRVANWGCHTGLTSSTNDNQQWNLYPIGSNTPDPTKGGNPINNLIIQYNITPFLVLSGFSNVLSICFNGEGTLGIVDNDGCYCSIMNNSSKSTMYSKTNKFINHTDYMSNPGVITYHPLTNIFYVTNRGGDRGSPNSYIAQILQYTNGNRTIQYSDNFNSAAYLNNNLGFPLSVAAAPDKNLIVSSMAIWSDSSRSQTQKVLGAKLHIFAPAASGYGALQETSRHNVTDCNEFNFIKYNKKGDRLILLDKSTRTIYLMNVTSGASLSVIFASAFNEPGAFFHCADFSSKNYIAVSVINPTNVSDHVVVIFNKDFTLVNGDNAFLVLRNSSNRIHTPEYVLFDNNDNLIIANSGTNEVFIYYSPNYIESEKTVLSTGIVKPYTLAVNDKEGILAVGCYGSNNILFFEYGTPTIS